MSDSEDPIDPIDEDGGDDLFGDDDDNDIVAAPSPKARTIDDDDDSLASDPEGDNSRPQYARSDRARSEVTERRIQQQKIDRHHLPKPSDKTLRVMRIPKFLKIQPMPYDPETYEPDEYDIANATSEASQQVLRYQKDPSTSELKSNANIYRWSDGSVTISVGGEHYDISKKSLAPGPDQPYKEIQDGHFYAASVELSANLLVTTDHITEQYSVRPNKEVGDEALSLLAERMAEASNEGRSENMIIRTTKDPELEKRQAVMAEKEREKARRRRENAAAKLDGGLGRASGRGGLSIGDLEGRRAGGRKRGVPGSGKQKRRRPEYDSDDDLPQGVGRHEEYDREDGFVVGSDDEEMESGMDDDEEEEEEEEAPRRKRQRTVEVDEDASGDDVEPAETSARSRRRNVVDDDDDE